MQAYTGECGKGMAMARRVARGGPRGWSLVQIAHTAEVTRALARAAQARGFLSTPLQRRDIIALKVAVGCMTVPDSHTQIGHLGHRDRLAVHLTHAAIADTATNADTALVLSPTTVELTQLTGPHSARFPSPGFPPSALWPHDLSSREMLLVLPVGAWIATYYASPTRDAAPLQADLENLAFPLAGIPASSPPSTGDDPFGDYAAS